MAVAAAADSTDPQLLARTMETYFKDHVDYDVQLMNVNRRIAESFVSELKEVVVGNVRDLPISIGGVEKQGSAFEGLKCGEPDEFDFAIQFRIKNKKGNFVYVEGRNIGTTLPNSEKAAGYWKIELKSQDKAVLDEWNKLTDKWPDGGSRPCLSPRKVVQRLQSVIDKFVPSIDLTACMAGLSVNDCAASEAYYWRSQVSAIKRQTKGNPALTISLTKNDGKVIDVDVSPCIVDAEGRHFVPKRHPLLRGKPINPDNHYELLWMRTESQKELKKISSIDQAGTEKRKCMRVLKGALAHKETPFKQFHSSYIVKTAWLHIVDQYPKKEQWKGWEVLALRLRNLLDKLEVSFHEKSLTSYFNKQENILARFDAPFLESCEGFLKTLNNKLKSGQTSSFIQDLGLDGSGSAKTTRY